MQMKTAGVLLRSRYCVSGTGTSKALLLRCQRNDRGKNPPLNDRLSRGSEQHIHSSSGLLLNFGKET